MPEVKEAKPKRRVRRNYAGDWGRLTFYLATIIRIKDDAETPATEHLKGQLKAYRDIQSYMESK